MKFLDETQAKIFAIELGPCAARHGSAAVGAEVHVGRKEAEGERADAEGHLSTNIDQLNDM